MFARVFGPDPPYFIHADYDDPAAPIYDDDNEDDAAEAIQPIEDDA